VPSSPVTQVSSALHRLWGGTVLFLRSPARDAGANMAFDEAMMATATDRDATVVRVYSWAEPSVSFGRNQRCEGIYSAERCAALGVPAVRRPTGGRALLHAREVTYAVAAPIAFAPTLRGGYEAINDVLLAALQGMGVNVGRATPGERTPSPELAPCFESPSAGELVVGVQKLVGSAQHRGADAFLQHGSILLDDDQGLLRELALVPLPPVPAPATLHGMLGAVEEDAVVDAIAAALRGVVTGTLVESSDSEIASHHVAAAASRYRDSRWTWRR
jgi:lipoate-protein ligase A